MRGVVRDGMFDIVQDNLGRSARTLRISPQAFAAAVGRLIRLFSDPFRCALQSETRIAGLLLPPPRRSLTVSSLPPPRAAAKDQVRAEWRPDPAHPRVALFDLDDTLIDINSGWLWTKKEWRVGRIRWHEVWIAIITSARRRRPRHVLPPLPASARERAGLRLASPPALRTSPPPPALTPSRPFNPPRPPPRAPPHPAHRGKVIKYMLGYTDSVDKVIHEAAKTYTGFSSEVLRHETREWFVEEVAPRMRPKAAGVLAYHREQGERRAAAGARRTAA